MPHSGNAATRYGPFLPMAAGDYGIRDFQTFTLSGGTAYTGSGILVLHLVKPLWSMPIVASGMYTERDFVNQLPSLPKIPDGAYLKFLLFQTGATTEQLASGRQLRLRLGIEPWHSSRQRDASSRA